MTMADHMLPRWQKRSSREEKLHSLCSRDLKEHLWELKKKLIQRRFVLRKEFEIAF